MNLQLLLLIYDGIRILIIYFLCLSELVTGAHLHTSLHNRTNSPLAALFFFCLLGIVVCSPTGTEARQYDLDTIPSLEKQLTDLLYEPFVDEPDAIMDYFNVLTAYEIWADRKRIRDFTPLVERIDILTEKARAEMLVGTFLSLILEEYVVMESGVLPITEKAIARLDSANYRLTEIIQYGVEGTESLYQMDADFTEFMSDSLKTIRDAFKNVHMSVATQNYDPRRLIVNCFDEARRDYPSHVYRRSLSFWFYESITDEDKEEEE